MNISWTITNLERRITDGFVTCAHWKCEVADGAVSEGIAEMSYWNDGDVLIPYENLAEQQVLDWVCAGGIDKQDVEKKLLAKVEAKKIPILAIGLPW